MASGVSILRLCSLSISFKTPKRGAHLTRDLVINFILEYINRYTSDDTIE